MGVIAGGLDGFKCSIEVIAGTTKSIVPIDIVANLVEEFAQFSKAEAELGVVGVLMCG